ASLPRVRGDVVGRRADLARHLADDHADDVRVDTEAGRSRRRRAPAGLDRAPARARLRLSARALRAKPRLGTREQGPRHADPARRGRAERLPVSGGAEEPRSEEHTSELQSLAYIVCRLLL